MRKRLAVKKIMIWKLFLTLDNGSMRKKPDKLTYYTVWFTKYVY